MVFQTVTCSYLKQCMFQNALHTSQCLDHVSPIVVQIPQLAVVALMCPPERVLFEHLKLLEVCAHTPALVVGQGMTIFLLSGKEGVFRYVLTKGYAFFVKKKNGCLVDRKGRSMCYVWGMPWFRKKQCVTQKNIYIRKWEEGLDWIWSVVFRLYHFLFDHFRYISLTLDSYLTVDCASKLSDTRYYAI